MLKRFKWLISDKVNTTIIMSVQVSPNSPTLLANIPFLTVIDFPCPAIPGAGGAEDRLPPSPYVDPLQPLLSDDRLRGPGDDDVIITSLG